MGGHPSLWTGFPLNLAGPRVESFSKIRRLDWVKSVSITPLPGRELRNCKDVIQHFERMEEMFVLANEGETIYDYSEIISRKLWAVNNRLVRAGVSNMCK